MTMFNCPDQLLQQTRERNQNLARVYDLAPSQFVCPVSFPVRGCDTGRLPSHVAQQANRPKGA